MKTCSVCGNTKPQSDFYSHSGRQCKACKVQRARTWQQANRERRNAWATEYGKRPEVRQRIATYQRRYNAENYDADRQRARTFLRKYGLTVADYDAMMLKQDGRCATCRQAAPLHVDHDHNTGRVRGLLCKGCNVALGMVRDDQDTLRSLIGYLDTHTV